MFHIYILGSTDLCWNTPNIYKLPIIGTSVNIKSILLRARSYWLRQRQRKLNKFFRQEWVTLISMGAFTWRPATTTTAMMSSSVGFYAQLWRQRHSFPAFAAVSMNMSLQKAKCIFLKIAQIFWTLPRVVLRIDKNSFYNDLQWCIYFWLCKYSEKIKRE